MFVFKKIFSKFLFPLPLTLMFSLAGLYLLWFTSKKKTGKILVSFSIFFIFILSYSILPDYLLLPIENKYPPYTDATILADRKPVKYVVVLGAGYIYDESLPLTSQITREGLIRLIEGIRIHRKLPESKLIFTGAGVNNPVPTATVMAKLAIDLGVSKSNIITRTEPKDTKDEARIIKQTIKAEPFVLVTSASHMPRAMALFKTMGLSPIPAPTEHNVHKFKLSSNLFFPNASNLRKSEKVFYEHMGMLWAKLRGQI